eukprot:TRINITY_DN99764_c0_g1_i1.p1 TRINITY_DN99764_c0_g1~~TRINITY_DN99764_c0_g1_i1.p1  ORF type:complete len:101 (+),score=21.34 TRINITY_DN99764_c0_g1_i1:3-305(+)
MKEELDDLQLNHPWDLVPCTHVKPIGCKSVKMESNSSLDRYKAHLIALGNGQEYGIDHDETFAPVAKITTVHILLALAASHSLPPFQMDVKNAFFPGDLK